MLVPHNNNMPQRISSSLPHHHHARKPTMSSSRFFSASISAICAFVMILAGGVFVGVHAPLLDDLSCPCAGGGLLFRDLTNPWKMLPRTLLDGGRDICGRCRHGCCLLEVVDDDAHVSVCAFACCCCSVASRFATSAASRSS